MLYLTTTTSNVLSLFFQIYKIEGVENKHAFFAFRFDPRTLMCHLTEMKHFTFTQLTSRNTSSTRVNADFKRMEITKFINKLTTNLFNYRKCEIVHNNIGSDEQFIVIVKHL